MKNRSVSEILRNAALIMEMGEIFKYETFTVICIYQAELFPVNHDTPTQQFFRELFTGPEYWPLLEDENKNKSWDWSSRIFALLFAAEIFDMEQEELAVLQKENTASQKQKQK